jgi:hypothetical protein
MNDDKKNEQRPYGADEAKKDEPIQVHNPFKKEDDKKITKEDIENEEKFREASTERD